jgi:pyroglutamyl-peptidase
MKILVTGFGPFDKFRSNPAEVLAEYLSIEYDQVEHAVLPVVYGEARESLLLEMDQKKPDVLVSFGLNGTIGHVNLEEIALNIRSSEVPDNSGNRLEDTPVVPRGELALRSSLPIRDIRNRLRGEGIPARISYSAGVYLCNEVFYTGMAWAGDNRKRAGFIHIPMATEMIADKPEMYKTPHMPIDTIKKSGRIIIEEVLKSVR